MGLGAIRPSSLLSGGAIRPSSLLSGGAIRPSSLLSGGAIRPSSLLLGGAIRPGYSMTECEPARNRNKEQSHFLRASLMAGMKSINEKRLQPRF